MDLNKKVLIFPAGTEIAFEIFNALKYSKFVTLYGGTSASDHSEFVYKNLISDFPYVDSPGFLEFLNHVIEEYDIDCLYPAHDSVCLFCSEHAEQIKAQVIVTEAQTTKICRSKMETYQWFKEEDFIPKTYADATEIVSYPVFVKPAVGQGSNGAMLINSEIELNSALKEDSTRIICEYLPGDEYTVDCFTDKERKLCAVKLRDRGRVKTGISVRSSSLEDDVDVLKIANTLNSKLNFKGAWFFQLKRNSKGEFKLLEVSPRIPGTMGLSRNMGINFPMLTLFVFWGFDVSIVDNKYSIVLDRAFYSAYKIDIEYEHVYIDYDDTLIIKDSVNKMLISFLYQAIEQGKKIHLLTKHIGDLYDDLKKFRISEKMFDEIILISKQDEKVDYISEKDAIFIDDSFAERKKVKDSLDIPVFDVDMIESLIDWRR